jgi:hypothetical protein
MALMHNPPQAHPRPFPKGREKQPALKRNFLLIGRLYLGKCRFASRPSTPLGVTFSKRQDLYKYKWDLAKAGYFFISLVPRPKGRG